MATKYVFTSNNGYAYKLGQQFIAIPDPSLYVNTNFIPFVPAGSYKDVSVFSTLMNSWEPSAGNNTWITFSNIVNKNGGGWGSFRATAPSNNVDDRIGTINVIARYNNWAIDVSQNEAAVVDSISINPDWLSWEGDLNPGEQKSIYVTASGSWTATVTSDPNEIVTAYTPSGSGSGTAYITVNNPATKSPRYAQITYTRGSASTVLYLCISGVISGICEVM